MSACKTFGEHIDKARVELEESYPNMDAKMIDYQMKAIEDKIRSGLQSRELIKADGEIEAKPIEFFSPDGKNIDLRENSGSRILAASMIADHKLVKEVYNSLVEIDENKNSEDHQRLLENTLDELIDWNANTIPEITQRININADATGGSLTIEDTATRKKGLTLRVNPKFNMNYLHLNGAETYVHEVLHAAVELAQKYHAGSIVGTMNDISEVYDQFMDVVTVEDFMPENSIDIEGDRERAQKLIDHMLDKDTGINEFIVMSKTNMLVHNVLRDRVEIKRKDRDTSTLWKKLVAAISALLESARLFTRGNKIGTTGSEAMSKYIIELNKANMGAAEKVKTYNTALKAAAQVLDFLNTKGSKHILKLINKFKKATAKAIIDSDTFDKLGPLQKLKQFSMTMAYFMSHPESRGSFETWLELLPFKVGMPEGTLQQILIKMRKKDGVAKAVEDVGLQSQKIEEEVSKIMTTQASMIDALFNKKLTTAQSESLTKIMGELDIEMLIDNDASTNTDPDRKHTGIKMTEFEEILRNDYKRNQLIKKKMKRLKELSNDDDDHTRHVTDLGVEIIDDSGKNKHYNFMVSQILGLADYLITGEAGKAQLLNAGSIAGMVGLSSNVSYVTRDSGSDRHNELLDTIDQLVSLEALDYTSLETRKQVADLIKEDPEAMAGVVNHLRGMNQAEKDMFQDSWQYDFFRVKGSLEKSGASWINLKTIKMTEREALEAEGYELVEGATTEPGYGTFRNNSYAQAGFEYEGIRATNFGRRTNSLIDGFKKSLYAANEHATTEEVNKAAIRELKKRQMATIEEMHAMQDKIQKPSKSGSSPIYKIGKGGAIYISDYDISVNKKIKEDVMLVRNGFSAVIGKTLSRFYDMVHSKDVNKEMMNIAFEDMENNYELNQNYYNGGKNNQMTYVTIGPNEKGDISKEIWPVLPRYMKVQIIQNHNKLTLKRLTKLAKNNPELNKALITDEIRMMMQKSKEASTDGKRLLLEMAIGSKIRTAIGKMNPALISKESKDKIHEIITAEPHVAVRRNLVYHYFGNREATLSDSNNVLGKVIRSNKYTKEAVGLVGTIVKEIASIKKVDVVLRNIPTLTGNINGNFLLNTLKGNNPINEIKKQSEGFDQLSKYLEIQKRITEENIKKSAINVDEKGYENKIKKIERRIEVLEVRLRRNLAHELVKAGLFTGSAEELDNEDLFKRTFVQTKIDDALKWMPKGIRTTLDSLYVTQGTPLYSGLLKFMQYSDFAARYSRYHKMIKDGVSSADAIQEVKNNQVNYNEGTGKALQWLSTFYVVPFPKFRIGIQRPVLDIIVDKPVNALIGGLMALATGNSNAPMAQLWGVNGLNNNSTNLFDELSTTATDGFDVVKIGNDILKTASIK